MKELQMNWTKLTPELKDKVLNIMVDDIYMSDKNYDFKNQFVAKMGVVAQVPMHTSSGPTSSGPTSSGPEIPTSSGPSLSSFGKSNFGNTQDMVYLGVVLAFVALIIFVVKKKNN
jgi:hypothetical protein